MMLATSTSGTVIIFILIAVCLLLLFIKYAIIKYFVDKMDLQQTNSNSFYKEQIRLLKEQNEILRKQNTRG